MSLTDDMRDGVEPGKLFVGGLSWDTSKDSLKAHFEQFGEVSDATVMKQPGTDVPRGFGFVTFANPENAALALSAKPHNLDGKTIDPKPATNKAEASRSGDPQLSTRDAPANKIFIGGTGDLTDDDIKAYFASKNQNVECELKYDKATGRTRGFGFVTFASEDETTKAVQDHIHQIKGKSVEAKYAQANRSAGRGNTQWPVQGGKPVAGFANPSVPSGYNYSAQMYSTPAQQQQQQQQQYYGQQQYYAGGNSAAAYYGYGYGGKEEGPMVGLMVQEQPHSKQWRVTPRKALAHTTPLQLLGVDMAVSTLLLLLLMDMINSNSSTRCHLSILTPKLQQGTIVASSKEVTMDSDYLSTTHSLDCNKDY